MTLNDRRIWHMKEDATDQTGKIAQEETMDILQGRLSN